MNADTLKKDIVLFYSEDDSFSGDANADYDRIIASCMMFQYAIGMASSGKSYSPSDVVSSYGKSFSAKAVSMMDGYTGYWDCVSYIKSLGKSGFYQYTGIEISELSAIASKGMAKPAFSCSSFSRAMYGFASLPIDQDGYLSSIHYSVMVPIASYFKKYRGSKDSDIHVDYASSGRHPGREIRFRIDGIGLAELLKGISESGAPLYSVGTHGGLAKIIAA